MAHDPASEQAAPRAVSVTVDLSACCAPDLALVDALARLHLAATRAGGRVRVRDASGRLIELLELVGLAELVGEDER